MAKSKREIQGCCNCLYSGEKYYCGIKAGEHIKGQRKRMAKKRLR